MDAEKAKKEFRYEYDKIADEETQDILEYSKNTKRRTGYSQAREESEDLINKWIDHATEARLMIDENGRMDINDLVRYVGSHRRSKIWATLVGLL